MTSTRKLFVANLKMMIRDRQVLAGSLMFPLIFLAAFSLFDLDLGPGTVGAGGTGAVDYFDWVLPAVIAMAAMQFAMLWTATTMARYREMGVLRRLDATPVRRGAFVSGQVLARVLVIAAQAALVLGVGVLFGANVAGDWATIVLFAVLGGITFLSLGFAIGSRSANPDAASMLASIITMPLIFLSGGWLPLEALPGILQDVVVWLPLAPLLDAMREVALSGATIADVIDELLIVAAWIPVLFLVARATFPLGRARA